MPRGPENQCIAERIAGGRGLLPRASGGEQGGLLVRRITGCHAIEGLEVRGRRDPGARGSRRLRQRSRRHPLGIRLAGGRDEGCDQQDRDWNSPGLPRAGRA